MRKKMLKFDPVEAQAIFQEAKDYVAGNQGEKEFAFETQTVEEQSKTAARKISVWRKLVSVINSVVF